MITNTLSTFVFLDTIQWYYISNHVNAMSLFLCDSVMTVDDKVGVKQDRKYSNFIVHRNCVVIIMLADASTPNGVKISRWLNTLRPRQNGRYFPDDIFKCIFVDENVWISIKISLKFVPKGPINNIQALVQMVAWRRPGDKPLSELTLVSLLTHICVIRSQWVNS